MFLHETVNSDFKDDSLDIMMYFSASAYSGFGDDAKVHYVYIQWNLSIVDTILGIGIDQSVLLNS